jgi:lactate dehydrogenase-like 2-hydroxyacid dehydrogenase
LNIVILDAKQLPPGAEFPELKSPRYGWEQYGEVAPEDIAQRCWRADIVVSLATPLTEQQLAGMEKLKLIVLPVGADRLVDLAAAQRRGVKVCTVAGDWKTPAGAAVWCQAVTDTLDAFMRGEPC